MFLDLNVTQTSKTELGKLDDQNISEEMQAERGNLILFGKTKIVISLENTRVIMEMYLPLGNSNHNFRI